MNNLQITTLEFKPDCNNKDIFCLNIITKEMLTFIDYKSKVIDNHEIFIKTVNNNLFTFGCKQLKDDYTHKAGYVWSSSASYINQIFATQLIEVEVNGCCGYAMSREDIREVIKDYGYAIPRGTAIIKV